MSHASPNTTPSRPLSIIHGTLRGVPSMLSSHAGSSHTYKPPNPDEFTHISVKDLEILDSIGSGSFGQVYKAKYKNRLVAVKFVNSSQKKEFETELQYLSGVNHPNIIKLYGASIAPPKFHLVMELGVTTLYQHLREAEYMFSDIFKWIMQIAEGMSYLHGRNIVHRDLKTANILLDANKHVKICDFGTSRQFDMTTVMTFVGTISYMAPELLREQAVSEKIDIYSFAMVVWEMMSGEIPFEGMKPVQIIWLVAGEGKRPPIPEEVPQPFVELITDCWQQDPKLRPSFKDILKRLMLHVGTDFDATLRAATSKGEAPRTLTSMQQEWQKTIKATLQQYKLAEFQHDAKMADLAKKTQELNLKEAALHLREQDLQDLDSDYEANVRRSLSCPAPVRRKGGRSNRHSGNPIVPLNAPGQSQSMTPPRQTNRHMHVREPSNESPGHSREGSGEGVEEPFMSEEELFRARAVSAATTAAHLAHPLPSGGFGAPAAPQGPQTVVRHQKELSPLRIPSLPIVIPPPANAGESNGATGHRRDPSSESGENMYSPNPDNLHSVGSAESEQFQSPVAPSPGGDMSNEMLLGPKSAPLQPSVGSAIPS